MNKKKFNWMSIQRHWLHSTQIVNMAQQIKHPTDPIKSFIERQIQTILNKKKNTKQYFDIKQEELQQIVNRLNIQTRLSKKQLDEQKTNGYRQIKVIEIHFIIIIITH